MTRDAKGGRRGKEIVEIKPVLLGGSPTDPRNKAVLDEDQHVEYVRYWNAIIRRLRKSGSR